MRSLLHVSIAFLVAVLCLTDTASAQKRVALVIGNSAYVHTPALGNPKNDAADVAAALASFGFEIVEGYDLDKASFDRTVRTFAVAMQGADVGVFFYAGHGLQVQGQNYLVPVDAELTAAAALDFEMVRKPMHDQQSIHHAIADFHQVAEQADELFAKRHIGFGFAPAVLRSGLQRADDARGRSEDRLAVAYMQPFEPPEPHLLNQVNQPPLRGR